MKKPIRLPRREMDKGEVQIMWNFLNEVWLPTYPQKYRNNGTLDVWINKGPQFAGFVEEIKELIRVGYNLQPKHKFILNTLIPRWKADGREEFMKLYKEYKNPSGL